MYRLETLMIKSEEKCVTQSDPKLFQDIALLCDTPTPPQTIAQPMIRTKNFITRQSYSR